MPPDRDFIDAIEQNQKIIHKVCNLYMNHDQDKKDLFQEIVLAAWKGYSNLRGMQNFQHGCTACRLIPP